MLPLVLLGLLGVTASAFLFDWFDSDSAEEDSPNLTENEDTVTATEGDDILTPEDFENLSPRGWVDGEFQDTRNVINLLGGDDVLEDVAAINNLEATINGGDGDDVIRADQGNAGGWRGVINGNAGDDTLSANAGVIVRGGDGDDQIQYSSNGDESLNQSIVDGGDGNDTIHVVDVLGTNYAEHGGPIAEVSGGEGEDTITIEFVDGVREDGALYGGPDFQGEDIASVSIQDFNPDEDTLILDISSFEENGNLAFDEAELTEIAGGYQLTLSFLAEGATDPFTASMIINSQSEISLDDLTIVQS